MCTGTARRTAPTTAVSLSGPLGSEAPPPRRLPTAAGHPTPANWIKLTGEAQTGDHPSTPEPSRTAPHLRPENPALGDGTMTWLDTPVGVLAFRRDPGFVCVVNLSGEAYPLPDHSSVLRASGPVEDGVLTPDQAAWLAV